jgi:hypothetical protein
MRYKGIKGKAWEAVKRATRRRETDCYTCPARNLSGQNAQAGHFIPVALAGSNNTLSWDERQIHLQCGRCNGAGQGMAADYEARLIIEYGLETVEEFKRRRWKVDPVKNWQAIIDHFDAL